MHRNLGRVLVAWIVLLAAVPTSARADGSDATAVVKGFYGWYFSQATSSRGMCGNDWPNHLAGGRALFDPQFYTMLRDVLQHDATDHDAMLDWDPFAPGNGGPAVSYTLETPTVADKEGDVSVPVTTTICGGGNHRFQAHLTMLVRKVAGHYVIYDVFEGPDSKEGLRGILERDIKSIHE
jgi:hypothetical protein